MRISAALAASVGLLAGCNLAPPYERPAAPVAVGWNSPVAPPEPRAEATRRGWRDFFPDLAMQRLISVALANNRDLRVTALNVQAAAAQYRIQRAGLFPTIDLTGLEQAQRIPGGVQSATSSGGGAGAPPRAVSTVTHYYDVGVGFTAYELDFFGRVRNLDEKALQGYLGQEETRRSAQITLIAEVAGAYYTLAADRATLKVTQDTLDAQLTSYELIRRTLDAGTSTALALRQSQITVETARANLSLYSRQLAQDRNALGLLIGIAWSEDLELPDTMESLTLPTELSAGVPSEVLRNRPDVLAAEHQLRGANADIGAARAAFFPSISLTASAGTASSQLSGLFKQGSAAWTFSPQISVPIFAGGANRANLDLATIEKNISIAQYEKVIQEAFREVDDALAARGTLDEQLVAERALVAAATEAYHLADLRFKNGVENFLTVLDAERTLYTSQQGLIALELSRWQNLATLYKALGGGLKEHNDFL